MSTINIKKRQLVVHLHFVRQLPHLPHTDETVHFSKKNLCRWIKNQNHCNCTKNNIKINIERELMIWLTFLQNGDRICVAILHLCFLVSSFFFAKDLVQEIARNLRFINLDFTDKSSACNSLLKILIYYVLTR